MKVFNTLFSPARVQKLRFIFSCFFFVVAGTFILSCSKQDSAPPVPSTNQTQIIAGVKAGRFASGQLEAHYIKHGYQFGDITQEDYLLQAQALLNASPGEDVWEKIRPDGDVEHYRPSTGEFAVMTKTGKIRTYFKANQKYWMRQ